MASIRERGNGYQITVSCGYTSKGRKNVKTMTWEPQAGMTERQIQKELDRQAVLFEEAVKKGEYVSGRHMRLEEFCTEYLRFVENTLAPRTLDTYRKVIDQRIIPALGHIKLTDLRPIHVQKFIQQLQEDGQRLDKAGKPVKGGRLSSGSVRRIAAVLSSVLARAAKLELIAGNPAESKNIDLPKAEQSTVQVFDEQTAAAMLQALDDEPLKYQVLVHLALALGCRRGELVALRWRDIDLDAGAVSIGHSAYKLKGKRTALKDPKNRSSRRAVTLPQYCIPLLRCYRVEQNEERMKLGTLWQDGDWLFTKWNGEQMNPDTPTGWFPAFLKRHGLPHMKFHALRHTSATLLLYGGANIKAVSARLGHAKLETTNIYLHAIQSADKAAADTMDRMFGGKKNAQ